MRGKILIVTGLAVGYVLGARAGRERYEQIKRTATKFWHDPRVQQQVDRVEDFAKDKAPEVVDFISDNAKKVAGQVKSKASDVRGSGSSSSSKSSKTSGAAKKSTGSSSSATSK